MRVGQFNTFPYGGAATAARRLHASLRKQQVDSQFYFHRSDKGLAELGLDDSFHHLEFDESPPRPRNPLVSIWNRRQNKSRVKRIHRLYDTHLADRSPHEEVFAMAELPQQSFLDWPSISTDVVHLHWMSFFADYPSFFGSIPDHIPLVWTLHDMNPLTGGCHYSNGCERFKTGCGNCPQLIGKSVHDVSRVSFQLKQKVLKRKRMAVVTPSQWLNDLAKASRIWPDGTSFHVIRLCFDLQQLKPMDKTEARKRLGIQTDKVLIGFGAESIENKRKGFHHLLNGLRRLGGERVEGLVFGSGEIPNDPDLPKMNSMGFVNSLEQQRLIYSAADIVVVPSREDNQPQVGLEAMACGTPVVGFNAGGIPEYVRSGVTGYLAPVGDESALAAEIARLVDAPELRETMGAAARKMMESEFEIDQQASKYAGLYSELVSSAKRVAA